MTPGDPVEFTDDDGSVFEGDIEWLGATGVTRGCNPPLNDRFCPDEPVTRGQMAAFLHRALVGVLTPGEAREFTDDDGSVFEGDIEWLGATGVTRGCNPPVNDRFCPDRPVTRAEMATFLGRALDLTPLVPPPRPQAVLEEVVDGLPGALYLTAPNGDDRLFIVLKSGSIRIVDEGSLLPSSFLDISGLVSGGSEQGLLGMAFHPGYAANGRFFVDYTDAAGDTRVVEYRVSGDPDLADSAPVRTILVVDQPASNHNGGMITFGADGYLYVALGDGGGGGDPWDNGQNPSALLGSLLRLDVDGPDAYPADPTRTYAIPPDNPYAGGAGGAGEVWAYGLRNPWRFSFDGADHLYIGDVGQNAWEEVNVVDASTGGLNFGWDVLEGSHCYEPPTGCSTAGTTLPIVEYSHSEGRSVIGGYVYRGAELPHRAGHYFYGDAYGGWIRSFVVSGGKAIEHKDWTAELGPVFGIWSFGVDGHGELYVLTGGGTVYRMAAVTP
jgi:glucose/arabinose dehydrogenase